MRCRYGHGSYAARRSVVVLMVGIAVATVLVFSAVLVAAAAAAAAAAAPDGARHAQASTRQTSVRTTSITTGSVAAGVRGGAALCAKSPLCARGTAPAALRRRYCHSLRAAVGDLWRAVSPFQRGAGPAAAAAAAPPHPRSTELPYYTDDVLRGFILREAEQLLRANLIGQTHLLEPLLDALRTKLRHPHEPLVMHLAGDNGVGKTLTARLLSRALSRYCAADRDACDSGDNLLSISGTSFDGMDIASARAVIVSRVLAHLQVHPHGIVLIDDLTAMDPALVPVLAPLFGRAAQYPEQFRVDRGAADAPAPPSLGQLLVVITTDLGKQGRTVGLSTSRIEQLVRDTFVELYGTLLPAYTRTFAYLPFSTDTAAAVVRNAVASLPCTVGLYAPPPASSSAPPPSASAPLRALGSALSTAVLAPLSALASSSLLAGPGHRYVAVVASSIDEVAVHFLVERHRATWEGKENGHALRRAIEDELVAQLLRLQDDSAVAEGFSGRIIARFVLDTEKMAVVLDSTGDVAAREEMRGAAMRNGEHCAATEAKDADL